MTTDARDNEPRRDVFRLPGYLAFWTAYSVSGFGTYITTIALQVLVVLTLGGTAADVGLVNGARWLPYLLFGLVIGALVDRRRRKPLLVGADFARALLLGAIPALWALGWLSLPVLIVFVAVFGFFALVGDAASISLLPRIVPRAYLLPAHARTDQSDAVAQTSGPVVAGGLITLVGAPIAVLVDAASYLISGVLVSRIRVAEPPAEVRRRRQLGPDIRAGLRWVYRHRTLTPMAIGTHGWFLFNAVLTTVFVPFALLELRLTAFELGLALAAAGVAGLLGSSVSTRLGTRWGVGRTVIACNILMAVGWAVIALVPAGGTVLVIVVLAVGQGLYGLGLGLSNANEMGYRQAITPDNLQARMNTTIRSVNRAMIVVGAPLGGFLAVGLGYRLALWIGVGGFVLVVMFLALSPFRSARHGDALSAGAEG